MNTIANSYVTSDMRKALEGHQLKRIDKAERFECYRMGRPGEGNLAVYITFMSHNADPGEASRGQMIVISGDLIISEDANVVASRYGYGLGWFSGPLSEDYLCEKFLRKANSVEIALEDIERHIRATRDSKDSDAMDLQCAKDLEDLAESILEEGCHGDVSFDEVVTRYDEIVGDRDIGYGYDRSEAGWLCAVQQRFAELYAKDFGDAP